MLHGINGTADVFYRQFISLCPKGYRLVAVQLPAFDNHHDLANGLDEFLSYLQNSKKIHLLGTNLGGYVAQTYAHTFPTRVESLILCNTFSDIKDPSSVNLWKWVPNFVVEQQLISGMPTGEVEGRIADSIDFVVRHLPTLTSDEMASRLALTSRKSNFNPGTLVLNPINITIIDTIDQTSLTDFSTESVYKAFPKAHQANMKTGGDFPYLSRPDEFNMHIEVHLRRLGYYRPGVSQTEAPKDL